MFISSVLAYLCFIISTVVTDIGYISKENDKPGLKISPYLLFIPPVCIPKKGNSITVQVMFHGGQSQTQGKRFFKATLSPYVSCKGFCHHLVEKLQNCFYFMRWRPCSHFAVDRGLMLMDDGNLLMSLLPYDTYLVQHEDVYSKSARNGTTRIKYIQYFRELLTYCSGIFTLNSPDIQMYSQ